jgi:hypothetical protein
MQSKKSHATAQGLSAKISINQAGSSSPVVLSVREYGNASVVAKIPQLVWW